MARQLIDDARVELATSSTPLCISEITVGALGLVSGATMDAIVARAAVHGLAPGPLGLGPRMRLHYPDEPEGRAEDGDA
jgi:hypothetical protein